MSDSKDYLKRLEAENIQLQKDNARVQQLERQINILKGCFLVSQVIIKEQIYGNDMIRFSQFMGSFDIALHPDYIVESEMQPKYSQEEYYKLIKDFLKKVDDV